MYTCIYMLSNRHKYLKYKKKYINLKNLMGGNYTRKQQMEILMSFIISI